DDLAGDTGVPVQPGAYCDRAAQLCAVPTAQREKRTVTYTLSPHFPSYLVRSSFQVVGDWNETFMRGWRASRNLAPPDAENVPAQHTDPTAYCWVSNDTRTGG